MPACSIAPEEPRHCRENQDDESSETAAPEAMDLDGESNQTAAHEAMDLEEYEEAPTDALCPHFAQSEELQGYVASSSASPLTPLPSEFEDDSERILQENTEQVSQDHDSGPVVSAIYVKILEPTSCLGYDQRTESDTNGWELNLTSHSTLSGGIPEDSGKLAMGTALPDHPGEIQASTIELDNKGGQELGGSSCEQPHTPDLQPQDSGASCIPSSTPARTIPDNGVADTFTQTTIPLHSNTDLVSKNALSSGPVQTQNSGASCMPPSTPVRANPDNSVADTFTQSTILLPFNTDLVSEDDVASENELVTSTTPCPQTASMTSPTSPLTSIPASSPHEAAVLEHCASPTSSSYLLRSSPPLPTAQLDQLSKGSPPETQGAPGNSAISKTTTYKSPLAQVHSEAKIMTSPTITPSAEMGPTRRSKHMADEDLSPLARVQSLSLPAGNNITSLMPSPETEAIGTPTTVLDQDQSPLAQMQSVSLSKGHSVAFPSRLPPIEVQPTGNPVAVEEEDQLPCTPTLPNDKSTPGPAHSKKPVQPSKPMLPKHKQDSSTRTFDQLVDRIKESYTEHGLTTDGFQFTSQKPTDDFRVINLPNRTRASAVLDQKKVDELRELCHETILSSLPRRSKAGSRDIHLLLKLSKHSMATRRPETVEAAIFDLERGVLEYTYFNNFLINSLLAVLKSTKEEKVCGLSLFTYSSCNLAEAPQYKETKGRLSSHDHQMFIAHQAIHLVFGGLEPSWKGLHVPLLYFLRKVPLPRIK